MKEDYKVWNVNPVIAEKASRKFKLTHGMFAGVPIICKDSGCPYVGVCEVDPKDRLVGTRCPMEAGAIVERFNSWCRHFEIDLSQGKIKDEDLADVSLIKDLVELEVQILRTENRIAIRGDFLGMTIVEIDKKGKVYKELAVTPEAEYKLSLMDKRHKVLQLLNATRKDKSKTLQLLDNPSEKVKSIFNKIDKKLPVNIDNVNLDDIPDEIPNTEFLNSEPIKEDISEKEVIEQEEKNSEVQELEECDASLLDDLGDLTTEELDNFIF